MIPPPWARFTWAWSMCSSSNVRSSAPREDGLADCEFVPIGGLRDHWDEFETWSQICIEAFLRAR